MRWFVTALTFNLPKIFQKIDLRGRGIKSTSLGSGYVILKHLKPVRSTLVIGFPWCSHASPSLRVVQPENLGSP